MTLVRGADQAGEFFPTVKPIGSLLMRAAKGASRNVALSSAISWTSDPYRVAIIITKLRVLSGESQQ